jgi:DNA-binding transcriptional regulator YhcF (GntR family)
MPKVTVRLKKSSGESITQQIANQITDQIKSGRLKPGDPLPSTLVLSEQLGIAPESVRRAYLQLKENRLIETELRGSRVRGGTKKGATKKGSASKSSKKK